MATAKRQYCVWCGEFLGFFAYTRCLDGPLVCDSPDCQEAVREQERDEVADRRYDQDRDEGRGMLDRCH